MAKAKSKTRIVKPNAKPKSVKPTAPSEGQEAMDFFPGQRLKTQLRAWGPRKSPAKEFRLHLDLSIPLSAEVRKMPHQIAAAFESVATINNGIPSSDVETPVEPQTLRVFSTSENVRPVFSWPASVLNNLEVVRPKLQSKKAVDEVELRFSTTVKVSDEQLVWAKNHTRMFFWVEFEQTEEKLIKPAKTKEQDEEEEQQLILDQLAHEPDDYSGSVQQAAVQEITTGRKTGKDAAAGDKDD